jgi:FtsZ-binding cell division protein ZapB
MRFIVRLWPCLVVCVALAVTGCTSPNTKVADLQRENARLVVEKQRLALEVTTLRNKLNAFTAQTRHWQPGPGNVRDLKEHINQLTQAQVRRQMVQRAIDLAEAQLQEARRGKPQAAADVEQALRVARATTEEYPRTTK